MLRIDEYGGQTITERKDGWFDNDVEGTANRGSVCACKRLIQCNV